MNKIKSLLSLIIILTLRMPLTNTYCTNRIKYAYPDYSKAVNQFYDRAVAVMYYNRILAPGVFIDYHLILTSYTPLRRLRTSGTGLGAIKVCVLRNRMSEYDDDTKTYNYFYNTTSHSLTCARQIVPIPEGKMYEAQWHGAEKIHSPLHDLAVLRLIPNTVTRRKNKHQPWPYFPIVSSIAKPEDKLGTSLEMTAFAFLDEEHIEKYKDTLLSLYSSDMEIMDCNKLMPNVWGYFICLKNVDSLTRLPSGALLFHKKALYGMGSFILNKGNLSVLVFTDVREYYHMLGSPCSKWEMNFIDPLSFPVISVKWSHFYYLRPDNLYEDYGRNHGWKSER